MSERFRCRYYRPSDRQGLQTLFRAVYGDEAERKTSAWRYLDNPPEEALIIVAEADGRIVGAQPSHVIRIECHGSDVRGLLLLDVMTHPDFRGRGVFAAVVETLREDAHAHGLRILLTTPNEAAARGFRHLDQWRCLGELSPLLLPIEPGAVLSRRRSIQSALRPLSRLPFLTGRHLLAHQVPAHIEHDATQFASPNDMLWRRFRGTSPCTLVRDDRFIRWRYSQKPRRYRLYSLADGAGSTALAVTAPGRLLGRDLLLLVDLMIPHDSSAMLENLLAAVYRDAESLGVAAIMTYLSPGSPLMGPLRASGFWIIPSILRPRPYTVWGAGDAGNDQGRALLDFGAWHMMMADSDLA